MKQFDFKTKKLIEVEQYCDSSLKFLYNNSFGRICLRLINGRALSKLVGKYQSSSLSKRAISKFISKYNINMMDYEVEDYSSFNDFFSRQVLLEKRPFSFLNGDFCSSCDAKLLVYKITEDCTFKVKQSVYTVDSLIKNSELSNEFKEGYCLVFRLTVDDYHKYHFFDDGTVTKKYFISGRLHTVSPIAYDRYSVFSENCREVNVLETKNFGKVIQVEVGALLVGKIVNYPVKEFKRGQLKGYFQFGGSTIVVFVKKDEVKLDKDIIDQSNNNIEVIVKMGQVIGKK